MLIILGLAFTGLVVLSLSDRLTSYVNQTPTSTKGWLYIAMIIIVMIIVLTLLR